jgi:O-antigen/teichoic acid export membrane protein
MPEDFGLVAMVGIVISIGQSLRDSGMTQSLVRSNDLEEVDYSTVFFLNLTMSILIYGLVYFLSPNIANFYNEPLLIDVLRVLAIQIPISAIASIQDIRLVKRMRFKKQTMIQVPAQLVGGGVGVYCALNGFGVWAIIYMALTQALFRTLILWFSSSWRPAFVFSIRKLVYHFNFGYKLTLSGLLDTAYQNLFKVLIGKFYTPSDLGFYSRAQSTKQLPVNNLSSALNKVTFPMFAEVKDDDVRLKNIYSRLMIQVVFWIAPVMLLLSLIAKPLFLLVYTEKWLAAVPMFKWLCIAGLLYPLHAYNLGILKIKGRSDLFLRLEIIKKTYTVILVFLLVSKGIMVLIYLQVATSIIGLFINSYYSGKLIDYSLFKQMRDILPSLILAVSVFGLTYLLYINVALQFSNLVQVVLVGSVFCVSYFGAAYLLRLRAISDAKVLILKK